MYIRCLFKYDPLKDTLLPNANLGIAFKSGDVLELVDSQDLNWWQARRLDSPNSPVGLVPSQTLEERRQAFNQQARRCKYFVHFGGDCTIELIPKKNNLFTHYQKINLTVR